jgi:menaquinone-dependent protoporphyrinogen oxidase
MKLLITYASVHGSTAEIALFLKRVLTIYNIEVSVQRVDEVTSIAEYAAVIIGTPIREGMWMHEVFDFIGRFKDELAQKPCYFWMTCIRVLETDGYQHALQNYVHQQTVEMLNIRDIAVFAGKLKLENINWDERWLLSLTYDGEKRPAFLNRDFRNWETIAAWGNKIANQLKFVPSFEPEVMEAAVR